MSEIERQAEAAAKLGQAMHGLSRKVGPWKNCPQCGAPPERQEVRNYDPIWLDGKVYCLDCGAFCRDWDAG